MLCTYGYTPASKPSLTLDLTTVFFTINRGGIFTHLNGRYAVVTVAISRQCL